MGSVDDGTTLGWGHGACRGLGVARHGVALLALFAGLLLSAPPATAGQIPRDVIESIATSTAEEGGDAANVLDGRRSTAWLSDKGDTVGATLTVRFRSPRYVRAIRVSGAMRSMKRMRGWPSRPKAVKVTAGATTFELELPDTTARVTLPLPQTIATDTLVFTVTALHERRQRVALGELDFLEVDDPIASIPGLREAVERDAGAFGRDPSAATLATVVAHGPAAFDALKAAGKTCDEPAFTLALRGMRALDPTQTDEISIAAIETRGADCAEAVLDSLTAHPHSDVAKALADVAKGAEAPLAHRILSRLAETGDPHAVVVLEGLLGEGTPVQVELATTLLSTAGPAGIAALTRATKLDDSERRRAAIDALAGAGDHTAATGSLSAVVARGDSPEARQAIRGLGRVGDGGSLAALRRIVTTNEAGRTEALLTLSSHGHLRGDPNAWLGWIAPDAQERVLWELGRRKSDTASQVLANVVIDRPARPVRQAAISALAKQGEQGFDAMFAALEVIPTRIPEARAYFDIAAPAIADRAAMKLASLKYHESLDELRSVLLDVIARGGTSAHATQVYGVYKSATATPKIKREALQTMANLRSDSIASQLLAESSNDDLAGLRFAAAAQMASPGLVDALFARFEEVLPGDWTAGVIQNMGAVDAARTLALTGDRFMFAKRRARFAILEVANKVQNREALEVLFEGAVSRDSAVRRRALAYLSTQGYDDDRRRAMRLGEVVIRD